MFETLILAVVQGIAEFLPISSSGHLVILGALMGQTSESPTLEVILHAGTLGSILVVYWRRILNLLSSDRRVIPLLIIGTLPAVVVGLTIKTSFEHILKNPLLAGSCLIVTGIMLIVLGKLKPREGNYQGMSYVGAFLVGCFQAFAILPGISRSGSTILGGRMLGLKNDDSVTFSFLLAIPAICGATLLTLKDVYEQYSAGLPMEYDIATLVIGAAVSFGVGIVALNWLIKWSASNRLHWFAWWCIPAGIAVVGYASLQM
ncbi:undecaprenyl-diphosphate phosphatase [Rubripirellula amarantea]|uniref:undecaprenyl-diphosphate phosphatase n=1 Tax=Rubripirellula amarantea TaxID=2527999 RepID=UPI001F5EC325|nr:undecaprenyl-diphosphate phosphatase [Rubripirellula amarantea]MDA8746252.1 undecaprenyl-diphosphate phosphatase [Rubripirellula amarantea]